MSSQLDQALVRIRDGGGRVVGTGFLVGSREVLTCAHVVARAVAEPDSLVVAPDVEVQLDFPLIAPGDVVTATITVWEPPQVDGTADIAGLSLKGVPPADAKSVRLVDAGEVWGHSFRTFGFPARHDDGVWASGRLLGRQAMGWVQIEDPNTTGFRVEPGFSGAPVWDDQLEGVVGMAVAAEMGREVRAAYMIPTDDLIRTWAALAVQVIPPCPYRGLLAFREQDSAAFFGREELAHQLLNAVIDRPVVAVVGPSGSGKSSLVFAGTMPLLRRHEGWIIVDFRPADGTSPLAALASVLLPLLEPHMTEAQRLRELPTLAAVLADARLVEVANRVLKQTGGDHLLLIVDQFEDTYIQDPVVARQFIDVLLGAMAVDAERQRPAITVVLTLRADFLGQALEHPRFAEVLQSSVFVIGRMTKEQLRRAIEGPIGNQVAYQPGLTERILADVGEEPGNLPLLEFALALLWEHQQNRTLTHTAYETLGGVAGTLARYAEETYPRNISEQAEVRRLFVQLVRPGDATYHTRRVARRSDLDDARWRVAQRLAATRLVVTGRDADGMETVEITHEALILAWDRLQSWIRSDVWFRAWQERLRSAMQQWEGSDRDDGALLRGAPLAEAERWLIQRHADLSLDEKAFIEASRILQGKVERRTRSMIGGLCALMVVAAILGALWFQQSRRADRQGTLATSRALAAQAVRMSNNPDLSILLGLAAWRVAPTEEARSGLLNQIEHWRGVRAFLTGHSDTVTGVAFSPDGHTLATGSVDQSVIVWDTIRRNRLNTLRGHAWVNCVAFSPNGHTLVAGNFDGTITFWDAFSGSSGGPLRGHAKPISSLAFSPDGHTLASASYDGNVILWDVAQQTRLGILHGHAWLNTVVFSPDGRTLATGGVSNSVILWDVARRAPLGTLRGHTKQVTSVAFSSDGRILATGSGDRSVMLWDLARRARLGTLYGASWVNSVAFSSDGRILAMGSVDGTVTLWDMARRARLGTPLDGHTSAVKSVAFAPDGTTLASAGADNLVILWDIARLALTGHTRTVASVAFSPDGRTAASSGYDGAVMLWDLARRERLGTIRGHTGPVNSVVFSPDGRTLASAGNDGTVVLRGVGSRVAARTLGRSKRIGSIAFSPDGRTLAVGSADRTVVLWDVDRRARLAVLRGHTNWVGSVAFSPDGHTLASGSFDGTVILWDVNTHALRDTLRGHTNWVTSVAFSPDGHTLASGSFDGTVILWDPIRRARLGTLRGHDGAVKSVAFSPDGRTVASAGEDRTIILWDADPESWRRHLCSIVGRGLTQAEWDRFVPGQRYRDTCV